jgi:hypothetical protein
VAALAGGLAFRSLFNIMDQVLGPAADCPDVQGLAEPSASHQQGLAEASASAQQGLAVPGESFSTESPSEQGTGGTSTGDDATITAAAAADADADADAVPQETPTLTPAAAEAAAAAAAAAVPPVLQQALIVQAALLVTQVKALHDSVFDSLCKMADGVRLERQCRVNGSIENHHQQQQQQQECGCQGAGEQSTAATYDTCTCEGCTAARATACNVGKQTITLQVGGCTDYCY